MENIYKVKIKTSPDLRASYPSERRYSASIVLGLSVFHLIFCALALTCALLSFLHPSSTEEEIDQIYDQDGNNSHGTKPYFLEEIEEEQKRHVLGTIHSITKFYLILTTLLLTIGCLLAGITGLLAWKRWYMDNNIKWFFVSSLLASILSMISIICAIITIVLVSQQVSTLIDHRKVEIHLHVHILILSVIELIFSVISTVIAYVGMRNNYPDETVVANGGGKIEVNTITKGNKKSKTSPPDIINHFHMAEKFAKYFPRKDNSYLPKAESNSEYQERVRKFLTSDTDDSVIRY